MSAIGGVGGSRIKKHPLQKTPSVLAAENVGDDIENDDDSSSTTSSSSFGNAPLTESDSEQASPKGSVCGNLPSAFSTADLKL